LRFTAAVHAKRYTHPINDVSGHTGEGRINGRQRDPNCQDSTVRQSLLQLELQNILPIAGSVSIFVLLQ